MCCIVKEYLDVTFSYLPHVGLLQGFEPLLDLYLVLGSQPHSAVAFLAFLVKTTEIHI